MNRDIRLCGAEAIEMKYPVCELCGKESKPGTQCINPSIYHDEVD